ncbi:MAG: hypothetical protein K6G91_02435 [Kiritimatiellae bacterium]|nr:hypothetical protein [Kiritimatiellia bacterium]
MKNISACLAAAMSAFAAVAAEPSYETLICHRGESVDAPENTLPAYKTAVDRGFGFECDIYLSKDGRCFTFHDGNLKRTTGGANTNRCSDVTWEELSALNVGGWGRWKGSSFEGTRPALLEEVLDLARDGRRIYVEIKTGPVIVPYVKRIVDAHKKANSGNILFISFNAETCAELKRQMPDYKVYLLLSSRDKVAGGKPVPVSADEVVRRVRKCGADGVDIKFDPEIHTAKFISAVKSAGLEFHVWTVDQSLKTMLAFCRGADTVTTNCAQKQLDEIAAAAAKQ